jgi:hypothetical protein
MPAGRTASLVEEGGVLVALATRDSRARGTYDAVGVQVVVVA